MLPFSAPPCTSETSAVWEKTDSKHSALPSEIANEAKSVQVTSLQGCQSFSLVSLHWCNYHGVNMLKERVKNPKVLQDYLCKWCYLKLRNKQKIRCNHFDALVCWEELMPAAWWRGTSVSHAWCVAWRSHPVTNGCATFHSMQVRPGAWTGAWGAAFLHSALWDTHHDVVMKGSTAYALGGSWGLFTPHVEIWRLFSLPRSSSCSIPSSPFQITELWWRTRWFSGLPWWESGSLGECVASPHVSRAVGAPLMISSGSNKFSPASLSTIASSCLSLVMSMPDDFCKHRTPTNVPTLS